MTYARSDASEYVKQRFARPLADAGVTDSLLDDWLAPSLDASLRAFSVAQTDLADGTVPDAQTGALLKVLDYCVWDQLAIDWGARVSTTTEAGLRRERQQTYEHASKERDRCQAIAAATGYLPDVSPPAVLQTVTYANDPYGTAAILLGRTY